MYSCNQHWLRKRHSYITQLLVVESWIEALDEGSSVDTIYLDFKKTFDIVPNKTEILRYQQSSKRTGPTVFQGNNVFYYAIANPHGVK